MSVISPKLRFPKNPSLPAPKPRTTATYRPRRLHRAPRAGLLSRTLPALSAGADAMVVMVTACLLSFVYQHEVLAPNDMTFGVLLATFFVATSIGRHHYATSAYLRVNGQMQSVIKAWTLSFVALISFGFFTKNGEFFSRGFAILVFVSGLLAVLSVRMILARAMPGWARRGLVSARSIFLVGDETSVHDFIGRYDLPALGLRFLGGSLLRTEGQHIDDDLALAAASARMLRPDDIVILAPWSDRAFITRCIDTFLRLPASIHIGPEPMLQQFADMHIVRNGPLTSVHLVRSPLSPLEVAVKRGFDLALAGIALLLLLPLLLLVSIAVKWDSPGPVLFRQTRYGFNQEPFRIVKFRTMTAQEDGAAVRQATRGDHRITRVGTWLRRSNLDELPQLFNVLRGHMSLVGPRPHAMAHDQAFERSVSLYARRHNMRPGITGWAQIHGWRGETDTEEKIRGRIEADLYYIDNWSLWLDVVILLRTLLSPSAYLNAR